MLNLRKNPVAGGKAAVIQEGQRLLVREFEKAPSKRHDRVEHLQQRNYTSRKEETKRELELLRECRISQTPQTARKEHNTFVTVR